MSISFNGTSGLTFPDASTQATGGYTGFRNRIINGGMTIDQRNAGASVTPTDSTYTLDRWQSRLSQASKYSVQRNVGSVTPPTGYINYLGITSLSAYSTLSSDYFAQCHNIEGFNIADLGWGTASAVTVTLSFWVRSSLNGTFGGSIRNAAGNRSYPFTYIINTSNTWEQKVITITGDTTGTWPTDNSAGIQIFLGLGVGSTLSGTAGAWAAGAYLSATGATSVVGTNGATFYITGVQLEKGSVATPFEFRPYGTELALCQRYYNVFNALTATSISTSYPLIPVSPIMRATPTITTTFSGGSGAAYQAFSVGGGQTIYQDPAHNSLGQSATIRATAEL